MQVSAQTMCTLFELTLENDGVKLIDMYPAAYPQYSYYQVPFPSLSSLGDPGWAGHAGCVEASGRCLAEWEASGGYAAVQKQKERPRLVEQADWGSWSHCTATCGSEGLQIRQRICSVCFCPWESRGTLERSGAHLQSCSVVGHIIKDVKPCNVLGCEAGDALPPVKGLWSAWGEWTSCSEDGNPCQGFAFHQLSIRYMSLM